MAPITLPTLGYFKNGNGWLGSLGPLRFQIEPPAEGNMQVVLWQGPFSRPYAPEVGRESFPVTEEGLAALGEFLAARSAALREKPVFSDEELNAYHRAKREAELSAEETAG